MQFKINSRRMAIFAVLATGIWISGALAQDPAKAKPEKPVLVRAVMCEKIMDHRPVNPSIIFSVSLGKAHCYNYFDPVPEQTVVYHKWFRDNQLIANIILSLSPPRWSTFSTIHLRGVDKGPWRVEIYSQDNTLLKTLMFSITE